MFIIGDVIKAKRKECELTQEELAALLGVTKAAVSKWETAESYPDITLLPKIAEQFHITMDELFGFCPKEQEPVIINCYKLCFIFRILRIDLFWITELSNAKYKNMVSRLAMKFSTNGKFLLQ